ncbi:hypothetical protein PhaeoP57_01852 [Phaeobacter inhibens]|nr:hypothetical protein PhaeoP51_01893 [Phaeobacter inhibens]AUQ82779.1 hypothetical protein PhaeoP57_01852 [Phaeobacter inhibens]AUQ90540.1 hypothetical protein PhaeoP24_01926 [Phaeobacter inhibens]
MKGTCDANFPCVNFRLDGTAFTGLAFEMMVDTSRCPIWISDNKHALPPRRYSNLKRTARDKYP